MLIIPPWTLFNILLYIGIAVITVLMIYADYHELWVLQYSRFSSGSGLPSRQGMFILYFLPIVVATIAAWSYLPTAGILQLAVYGAVVFHFTKRVLETLFLHKYSGTIAISAMVLIASFYSLVAGLICFQSAQTIPTMDVWFYLGIVFFVAGETGNFYHHKLLADLRKNSTDYHIPQGGLFQYVSGPHYFFELFVWLGILLLSRQLFALLAFVSMGAYLVERSVRTGQWYRQKFQEYPKDRKYIIPFLF